MTAPPAPAQTYGVGFPAEWTPIPLDDEGSATFLHETLDRLRQAELPATQVRRAELLLRQTRRQLVEADVRYTAVGLTVLKDSTSLLVTGGSLLVATRESLGSPQKLTPSAMVRALARRPDVPAREAPVDVEPPTTHDLAAGTSVRLRRYHEVMLDPGEVTQLYTESFLVPHDDGERLVTVQFVTPNVEFAHSLSNKVFEKSAQTLRIFREGDETTFEPPAAGAADA